MRLGNEEIKKPDPEFVPIPRGDKTLLFRADAVVDYDDFEDKCPEPKAPLVTRRDGSKQRLTNDKGYKDKIERRAKQRIGWLFMKSLAGTAGLTWDILDEDDPETWDKFEEEFKCTGLTPVEQSSIFQGVMAVNSLDDKRLEEARRIFTLSQEEASQDSSSQKDAPTTTPSGEPAKD